MTPYSVYVHVPWCRVRCPYCAFYVERDDVTPWPAFTDAILADLHAWRGTFTGPAQTVFLGGGTPSRMPISALERILSSIERQDGAEVSLEANPEDISSVWLDGAIQAGVNRLSLGVQTLNPKYARLLNRAHTCPQARETLALVGKSALTTWSLDLIFGLPGQTVDELDADLDALLECEPPHVSLYGLTIEAGTPFERAVQQGKLVPIEDDVWRQMYDRIVTRLQREGLKRYEVSNFARPGHESDHNLGYWTDRAYMGVGPSAHGYTPEGCRYTQIADASAWMKDVVGHRIIQRLTPHERAVDRLISGLRGVGGIARGSVPVPSNTVSALIQAGVLVDDQDHLRLSHAGFPVADAVIRRLVDALPVY
jgi:oxygen-independent coproporphyrinogen III oxidase